MRLHSLHYAEHEDSPQRWVLEGLSLGSRNLIVGKNSSGKSRTLNVISSLARNLAGLQPPGVSANYDCQFRHNEKSYRYLLRYRDQQVLSEQLSIDGEVLLDRGEGGIGHIFAEQIDGGKQLRFQTPTSELAAVVRRDAIQHSFLEPLYLWALSLRHYHFGTQLGKDSVAILNPNAPKVDDRDEGAVVGIFREAVKTFGDAFLKALIDDLALIDYYVTEIGVSSPVSVRFVSSMVGEPVGLYVREKDLPGITDQFGMSQGMFRVVSLLIQVNYFQFAKSASCVLIDDIGEGLDFDRSCRLIDLLRSKSDSSGLQIIMSTNDRFVMNNVPLEEWSVLQRKGSHVTVKNYDNSREIFEEFKFTGLSNFSFLELDVINEPHGAEDSPK